MREFYPLIAVGAVAGVLALIFLVAYLTMKNKKEAIGFDRNMNDGELVRRLLKYARPYIGNFITVLCLMIFSIAYDIISPLIIGNIEEMIKADFEMKRLFAMVAVYASILVVSLICSYFQAAHGSAHSIQYP